MNDAAGKTFHGAVKARLILCLLLAIFIMPHAAYCEEAKSSFILDEIVDANKDQHLIASPQETPISTGELRKLQEENRVNLLFGILVATPLFLFLVLIYIKKSTNFSAQSIVHGSGLVLVIQATLFVVLASPTTEQLTASIGVLGAIAGYLFGSARREKEEEKEKE